MTSRFKRIPLDKILVKPESTKDYLSIQNKYWPIDGDRNVFLTVEGMAIYGDTKQTVRFYIERMCLPVGFIYTCSNIKQYDLIFIETAWIKRTI